MKNDILNDVEGASASTVQTIAITVYSVVSKVLLVDIEGGLDFDSKVKLINDIAFDVYDSSYDFDDVYEKIHDVQFCELDEMEDCSGYVAVMGEDGVYELIEK